MTFTTKLNICQKLRENKLTWDLIWTFGNAKVNIHEVPVMSLVKDCVTIITSSATGAKNLIPR